MNNSIVIEIEQYLKLLPADKIKEVKTFIKSILSKPKHKSNLQQLAGCLTDKDASLMKKAIADGCEKINYAQW